jgi:hypothetical protein
MMATTRNIDSNHRETEMRYLRACVAAAMMAGVTGACAPSTSITQSWKDPASTHIKFNKIVAVCMCKDGAFRRSVEDEMAKRIQNSVASYTILPEGEVRDPERARQLFQQRGFDGAVVARLVGVDRETSYVPGAAYSVPASYRPMWGGGGYWGYGWGTVYSPGYLVEDKVVTMDTNVYSLAEGKLVWASRSATYNPESVSRLVGTIAAETTSEMRKQKLIE